MKKLTLIFILLSTGYCFGQSKTQKSNEKRLTISEIKKKFPYNKAESIKLVSFKYVYPVVDESDTTERVLPTYESEIPKTNGRVDMKEMFEVKTLDNKQEEELLNILFNSKTPETGSVVSCYNPRNGIVFFDKDERILGYIEICFECLKYKVEPSKIKIPVLYENGFDTLKDFFAKTGITYGTNEGED